MMFCGMYFISKQTPVLYRLLSFSYFYDPFFVIEFSLVGIPL